LGLLLVDGQQLGVPAQIAAAIVAFAIIGETTDWLIVLATAPLLRREDRFAKRGALNDLVRPSLTSTGRLQTTAREPRRAERLH
jgi:hypothetical protein